MEHDLPRGVTSRAAGREEVISDAIIDFIVMTSLGMDRTGVLEGDDEPTRACGLW